MKAFIGLAFLLLAQVGYGARIDNSYHHTASFTATNDTTEYIDETRPGSVLRRIYISTESGAGITVYDSSASATNQIADVAGSGHHDFDVRLSSGLTYSTRGNSTGITIIYELTHPR